MKQRAVRYDKNGNAIMINNLQKVRANFLSLCNNQQQVYEEIEIWRTLNHKNVVKIYEVSYSRSVNDSQSKDIRRS